MSGQEEGVFLCWRSAAPIAQDTVSDGARQTAEWLVGQRYNLARTRQVNYRILEDLFSV